MSAMGQYCEVCENFRSKAEQDDGRKIVKVDYDVRPVYLCRGHARIAENSGVKTFEELRELYGSGRRSYVPRRGPATAQTDGASRGIGRRSSDQPS